MNKTRVVNLYKEPYDVYVGRPGKGQSGYFGNPFKEETRGESIEKYRIYFSERIKSDPEFRYRVRALRGKVLGCFCKPKNCHADTIVEYLDTVLGKPLKYGVVGSREFSDYDYMKSILHWFEASCIISGAARGADRLAKKYADENSIKCVEFKPNWDKYGKKAGLIRNQQIVTASDAVIAFWDGTSPGTRHSLQLAKEMDKETFVFWKHSKPEDILENFGTKEEIGI